MGKMKVYSWNYDGRVRCTVATTSWKKAAEAARTSDSRAREYGSITGNEQEIAVALTHPGVALFRGMTLYGNPGAESYKTSADEAYEYQKQNHAERDARMNVDRKK